MVRGAGGLALLPPAPTDVLTALRSAIDDPARLRYSAADRLAYASDASHYALTPVAVVTPVGVAEIARLLGAAASAHTSLTFRSGGTSLSGQAVTDAVLVDTRRHFRGVEVLDGGLRVRVQPGATVRQVNMRLASHGTRLGPDPASEAACTVGGVIANNSSGMACGIEDNTYQTLESAVLVLPSGTVVDTGAADADDVLRGREPALHEGLLSLRDRVLRNARSVAEIRRQFALKNAMGYSLNAFLDYARPVDILTRLAVGSEGTLCFVAEAVFRAVPVLPDAATGLLVFENLRDAAAALPRLLPTCPAAVELLDAESLRVSQRHSHADAVLQRLSIREHTALLVEYRGRGTAEVSTAAAAAMAVVRALPLCTPAEFVQDRSTRDRIWTVRKGLYAAVAGARPVGTTALLEDIVVPVPRLVPVCEELTRLFVRHGYERSVVFGHAKDGNLHFMLNERFESPADLDRYHGFTDDMVDLVLGHGGSLKAEHGTGRIMAPFLRRQYGDELYGVMREIKRLCDPHNVLSPGVMFDDEPGAHFQHLKSAPPVEAEVDRCVECGYCEPVCPSRDLTTTPRQRIVLRRAMERARAAGDNALLRELETDYRYQAVETCAVDGMCQTACPVEINTGDLVRRLRADASGPVKKAAWRAVAGHWQATTRAAAAALNVAAALPDRFVSGATRAARRVAGEDNVPMWTADLPRGGARRPNLRADNPDAVYFPSCLSAIFAPADIGAHRGVVASFRWLCEQAGITLATPDGISSLCCGTPWKSKGLSSGYVHTSRRVELALFTATHGGRLPVVVDAASCTEGLAAAIAARSPSIQVIDVVEYAAEQVLPRISIARKVPSLALHPTCSSTRRGMDAALRTLAQAIAVEVVVPDNWGCCGFAGDRGLLLPDLTAAATRLEAQSLATRSFSAYASCNRTCEIGMAKATGRPFRHVIELLADVVDEGHNLVASPEVTT